MKFMSIDQEILMKNLYFVGVSMAKAKTFVLHAKSETINLVEEKLAKLDEYYNKLDEKIPDDSDQEVLDLPEYKNLADKFIVCFSNCLKDEVTEDQFSHVRDNLNPAFDVDRDLSW
jgi:hypothetical protein